MGGFSLSPIQEIKSQHSIEQWQKVFLDQQASGLSGRAYCQLHAIRKNRFYYWLHKIRKNIVDNQPVPPCNSQEPVHETQFAIVSAAAVTVRDSQGFVPKLILQYGSAKLEIPEHASPELLRQTLQVLQDVFPSC